METGNFRLRRTAAILLICLLSRLFVSGETLESYLKKLGYGSIPLERTKNNDLYVRGEINGKSRALPVDTGCTLTRIDTRIGSKLKTPKQLGVRVVDEALGEVEGEDMVVIEKLKLADAVFSNQIASKLSLKAYGFLDGILGCDFFIRNNSILDCAAKKLYVRGQPLSEDAGKSLAATLEKSGYHRAKASRSEALVPLCEADLDGAPVLMMLDTGATFTILDNATTHRYNIMVAQTGMRIGGIGRGWESGLAATEIKKFKVAGARMPLRGIKIGVGDLRPWGVGTTSKSPEKIDGLIGGELLAQSGAVIDFSTYTLWFVPEETK